MAVTARHTAVLGFGSNLGQSANILHAAWTALRDVPGITPGEISSPYRSQPLAMDSPHWFVNVVGLLQTSLSPRALLHILQAMEIEYGRVRDPNAVGYQDRRLDLDLLLYDDLILDSPELILPHPRMHERRFVLDPLGEVAGSIVLSPFDRPLKKWVEEHREKCKNQTVERCSWQALVVEPGRQPV